MTKKRLKSLPFWVTVMILFFLGGAFLSRAADDGGVWKECTITVLDPAGKPVAGATAMLAGMKPATGSSWAEGMDGSDRSAAQSDAQGRASLTFNATSYPNEEPVGIIRLLISYPDGHFICPEWKVDASPPVKLAPLIPVDFSPGPVPGVTFTHAEVDLQTDSWPGSINLTPAVPRPVIRACLPAGYYQARLTAHTTDQKTYYSDLVKITLAAPPGASSGKPVSVPEQFPMRETLEATKGGTVFLPQTGWFRSEGTSFDFLATASVILIAWLGFVIFAGLIRSPIPNFPWNSPFWIFLNVFFLLAYGLLCLSQGLGLSFFMGFMDLIPISIWVALIGLLYLARKKKWGWLSALCTLALGLLALVLALIGYFALTGLLADFSPRLTYREAFGALPSAEVRDLQGTRNYCFLDDSQAMLKFHANRATFEQIKSRELIRVTPKEFQRSYGLEYGGMQANYLRLEYQDSGNDQFLAAWEKKLNLADKEIWVLPRNSLRTEIVMTYDPSSSSVEYYFFQANP